MQLTNVRSKEKDYDIYLKSEKPVHSQQEHEKIVSRFIWKWKKLVLSYFEPENTFAAIWRKKKVDPCYFETKKYSSQLLGARKKIRTHT